MNEEPFQSLLTERYISFQGGVPALDSHKIYSIKESPDEENRIQNIDSRYIFSRIVLAAVSVRGK